MNFELTHNLAGLKAKSIYDPTTIDVVRAVFKEKGWGLPEDYGEFLTEWNGFTFSLSSDVRFPIAPSGEWDRIPFEWPSRIKDRFETSTICGQVRFLSGIGEKEVSDLRRNQGDYSFLQFAPKEFIRIGDGPHDESIALAVSGPHFGKVAYFGGAEANWPLKGEPSPSLDNLHFVALTFTDFWNSLVLGSDQRGQTPLIQTSER
jgi:hypothetical protein